MTGAEILLDTLAAHGVDVCFMNPGTSEMRFVAALDRVPAMRGVLCLFEGVATGAADGYARMTGRPAATLLHLGPGLANGLANLHNARKARSPVVNIVGEHSTQHQRYDAPLSADIAGFARPVSGWVRAVNDVAEMGTAAAEAIAAANEPPGQVATLIVAADVSWTEGGRGWWPSIAKRERARVAEESICRAAARLRQPGAALLLGGHCGSERALAAAGRLHAATGVAVFVERSTPRVACGRGRFQPPVVPYFPEPALAALAGVRTAVLVEAQPPVSFFGYPNTPSWLLPEGCEVLTLAERWQDGTAALEALCAVCGAAPVDWRAEAAAPQIPRGPLTADAIGAIVAARMPAGAIISDELISASAAVLPHLAHAAPHDRLPVTGGSIGQGLPVALGAAMACPERKVIALEADGSAMYTLQALWTMAREQADVLTVIFANRRYQILEIEMQRTGSAMGEAARAAMDIGRPDLDFVKLAEGMGVPASRAATAEEFDRQFGAALAVRGPRLMEAVLG
ncbi:MAG TPA: acetolactate synthase large subunit [Bryobacteraceae bacterium]|nr:acetolactate synthase large subunit [Bryobacteraceae bacterium]